MKNFNQAAHKQLIEALLEAGYEMQYSTDQFHYILVSDTILIADTQDVIQFECLHPYRHEIEYLARHMHPAIRRAALNYLEVAWNNVQ